MISIDFRSVGVLTLSAQDIKQAGILKKKGIKEKAARNNKKIEKSLSQLFDVEAEGEPRENPRESH